MPQEVSISGMQNGNRKWMILSAVMIGGIMGPIDGSIVNVVLPTIANYFQTDYAVAQWVPTIYLLAICSFILVYGLGSTFLNGKKVVFKQVDYQKPIFHNSK